MRRELVVLTILLSACVTADPPVERSAPAVRHTIFFGANRAGFQTTSYAPDGTARIHFEFNDRGRGPRLDTTVALGADGFPVILRTSGNDYLKAPVEESFTFGNGVARWKNSSEEGEKAVAAGAAIYSSMYGPPEEAAIIARALLRAPGQRLALLPAGESRIEKMRELTVAGPGGSERVALYSISGASFTPSWIWLEADLDLFAIVSSWSSIVREGWEETAASLLEAQQKIETEHFVRIAKRLTRRPAAPLVIRKANVFDSESGGTRSGMTVVVRGNRIEAVEPDGDALLARYPGAEVIDATGKTVLPGLWDMHVHLGEVDGILNIAAGVTTVRDLANDMETMLATKQQFDAGETIGPRMILGGFLDGPGPFAGPTKALVATEEEVVSWMEKYAANGYEQIKIYSSIKPELVPFIIREAHERGMRVSGHVPTTMRAEEVVRMGVDEIQHMNMLFLNFYPDVRETRTPSRFTEVGQRGATLDLTSDEVRAFVTLLKERGVVVDPTVSVFESIFTARQGAMDPSMAAVADRLPPEVRRRFLTGGLPGTGDTDNRHRGAYRKMLEFVRVLYEAGVPIVAGTDSLAGFTLHRELENYVAAGIPAPDVLRIATLGAARLMKRDHDLGSVAPGKLADLVIVDGDPSRNIADVRRVEIVIKDGAMFRSRDLYEAVNIH